MSEKEKLEYSNFLSGFQEINRKKICDEIAEQIKTQIKAGGLKPGDRIPTERDLAETLKVSRHSVQQAIRILEQEHVLKSVRGSGTYVTATENQNVISMIASHLLKQTDKLAEIFQLRLIVEPQIAHLAADNYSDDDLENLHAIIEHQMTILKQPEVSFGEYSWLDNDFHKAIAKATNNEVIKVLIERLGDIVAETRVDTYQSMARIKSSIESHVKILSAIQNREGDLAADLMKKHLLRVESVVMARLFRNEANNPVEGI